MKHHEFTLVLGGVDDNTPELEDKLFKVECDDALINFRNGTVYLDFDRQAETAEEAIISAIKLVENSGLNAHVVKVSPDEYVSETEIAKRLNITRQTISLWIKGSRRNGQCFPKPLLKLSERSPLWKWSEVAIWLYNNQIITDKEVIELAFLIENINAALEERDQNARNFRHQLLKKLAA